MKSWSGERQGLQVGFPRVVRSLPTRSEDLTCLDDGIGELVVRYLATLTDLNLKWAVAGRSKSKLEKVLAGVGISVPIVIADSNDPESLVHMVKQTTLVMSLVGPYTLYGSSLVKACAENGTHYVVSNQVAPCGLGC